MAAGLMVGGWFLLAGGGGDGKEISGKRGGAANERSAAKPKPKKREPSLPKMECPVDLTNCEVATGKVIYVEAVDPDGDGDAHFVTLSNQSITMTGMTVFDVKPELRPEPLPERGDLVGGFGPVYQGSYGQSQIEVIEFHVAK